MVSPSPSAPDPPVERRRRRRGLFSRLLTAPVPRPSRRTARAIGAVGRWTWPLVAVAGVAVGITLLWAARTPVLTARHRPEALCFSLARSRFAPPMTVEPSAALVRGRFAAHTPPGVAAREAMRFSDEMVIHERASRIGDYDVTVLWLRLPGSPGGHWLVVAWMEDSDLALCNFRFAGTETDLTPMELLWGQRLLESILVPENFQAGVVPPFRLRGEPPRSFGPKT